MIGQRPIFHYALVTLEALTAHGIQGGEQDATHDVSLLRDGNGLPALPGTSIAGVLRHLFEGCYGKDQGDNLFGYAAGDEGQPSWVRFSWGLVHDSNNSPVEVLRPTLDDDPILAFLADPHPIVRQRVRLNARGAASDMGKFDASLIPAGTRYSAYLCYWSDASEQAEANWQHLLALLSHPAFRLGHGTRAGAGAFVVNQLRAARWDLRTPEGQEGYRQRPRTRSEGIQLPAVTPSAHATPAPVQATLELQAESGWRVGGGDDALDLEVEKQPDLLPVSECRICWHAGKGAISPRQALLPASAVKGALAHRLAYHYRCLSGDWVEQAGEPQDPGQCPAVQELLGWASDGDQDGAVGRLLIDDLMFDQAHIYTQMHNRIDRFTGGVISGALFEEALLWQTPLRLTLSVLQLPGQPPVSGLTRQALERTLDDLSVGWLPLGAGGSRGQGVFIAPKGVQWSDQGFWIQARSGQEEQQP